MVEELDHPAVNRIVIVTCGNHAHGLVFQAEIAENRVLQNSLAAIITAERIPRSTSAVRYYGR
jgi:hypothetical protein